MKKLFSIVGGCVVGGIFAWGFIVLTPKLPDFFVQVFYTPIVQKPVELTQDLKDIFIPSSDQYFIQSVDQTIPETVKVAYADLGSMKISLYENGALVEEYPIQSVGREGTAWQTPLGKFDMSYKIENHFSSIGHVYMPFSMHFFGNYFIHGWPYYPSGMPVAEGYSGGCIRLNTPDAEKIYDFVDKNTELIVTTSSDIQVAQNQFQYHIKNSPPQLESNFLVVDLETGEVLATHNGKEKISIGSFAKLMTALISLESLNQYQEAVLHQDIVKISDVLYALLLGDDEEAGQVLYEHKNKNQYLVDMNTRAKSLGMTDTIYTDINGVSPKTVSTLEDSFKLMQYIQSYKPFLTKVLSLEEYAIGQTTYDVLHPLRESEQFVAGFVNTENTESITLLTIDVKNSSKEKESQKKTFALFVQGSLDANQDTLDLYEWVKESVVVR